METKSTRDVPSKRPESEEKDEGSELVPRLPKDEHGEELIDEALTETFPASDPISVPTPQDDRRK